MRFFEMRLRAGVQVSRPAEGLSLLRWKTPIDELVAVNLGRGVRWRRFKMKKMNEEDTKNINEEDKHIHYNTHTHAPQFTNAMQCDLPGIHSV